MLGLPSLWGEGLLASAGASVLIQFSVRSQLAVKNAQQDNSSESDYSIQ